MYKELKKMVDILIIKTIGICKNLYNIIFNNEPTTVDVYE